MKIYNDAQGSTEWIECRLGKFTASDAQAIQANGKGLETLVFEKIAEILTLKPISDYKNENMERGNELEQEAKEVYQLQTGNNVEIVGFCETDQWSGCSPDGMVGEDGLIEVKCPTPKVFAEFLCSGVVDSKYMAQIQMQLLVTDRKWCDYVVYHPDFPRPCLIKRIERDDVIIEKIKIGLEKGIKQLKEKMEKLNGK